jgi:Autographiviridae endonuclease VII
LKICQKCGVLKSLEDFQAHADCRDGRRPECRICDSKQRRERRAANRDLANTKMRAYCAANRERVNQQSSRYYHANREWARLQVTLKRYNLTLDQYHALQERQDFSCAICGDELQDGRYGTHVDHNHDTNRVRGLLCNGCNLGIGHFKERAGALISAARYVTA